MSWIQTYTGVAFDVLKPRAEMVRLEDVAHALSQLCRFGGHTREFYTVAQHSVLVSRRVLPEHALQALLHDAPEAYCVDMPKPLKHTDALAGYRVVEGRIWRAVAAAFGVPIELHVSVLYADTRMLLTEGRDLLGPAPLPWTVAGLAPYAERVMAMSAGAAKAAKAAFLARFDELAGA